MRFTWDETKRRENLRKHGLDFVDAARILDAPIAIQPDRRFDYDEERLIGLGTLDGQIVVLVFTESGDTFRIISLRRATRHEENIYYENFGRSA
jgi:hypothetical protein